jgi:hypothetical protein
MKESAIRGWFTLKLKKQSEPWTSGFEAYGRMYGEGNCGLSMLEIPPIWSIDIRTKQMVGFNPRHIVPLNFRKFWERQTAFW